MKNSESFAPAKTHDKFVAARPKNLILLHVDDYNNVLDNPVCLRATSFSNLNWSLAHHGCRLCGYRRLSRLLSLLFFFSITRIALLLLINCCLVDATQLVYVTPVKYSSASVIIPNRFTKYWIQSLLLRSISSCEVKYICQAGVRWE